MSPLPAGDKKRDKAEKTTADLGWTIVPPEGYQDSSVLVPEVGVEPTRPCGQRILSPPRLPFRHSGKPLLCNELEHYGQDPNGFKSP